VIIVLGGAALIALCFLYVSIVMFGGGKQFMRPVSRERREPRKPKRYRRYLHNLSGCVSRLSILQFFGPIALAFIMFHVAVMVLAAEQIGFYRPPLP
jgi:hypothetical protein